MIELLIVGWAGALALWGVLFYDRMRHRAEQRERMRRWREGR
jgi:hypothetical protein